MEKPRKRIPRSIQEPILKEFNHRCAKCGSDRPQLHHIDANPANNDPSNLIPLCPNCHLTDEHDPTRPFDPAKLRLFRQYKDPTILMPQFEPLFRRMKFLDEIRDDSDAADLLRKAGELIDFVQYLAMGGFYTTRLKMLLEMSQGHGITLFGNQSDDENHRKMVKQADAEYRQQLQRVRDEVYNLCVELLHYQNWKHD
jgi:hypothetical protein